MSDIKKEDLRQLKAAITPRVTLGLWNAVSSAPDIVTEVKMNWDFGFIEIISEGVSSTFKASFYVRTPNLGDNMRLWFVKEFSKKFFLTSLEFSRWIQDKRPDTIENQHSHK